VVSKHHSKLACGGYLGCLVTVDPACGDSPRARNVASTVTVLDQQHVIAVDNDDSGGGDDVSQRECFYHAMRRALTSRGGTKHLGSLRQSYIELIAMLQ